MERQYTWGGVPRRSLDVTIAAGDTSIVLSDGSSWPDNGPFWVTIERDTVNEERVLIASRALNTLTVATGGRGRDRTTARSHTAGSSIHVEHTLSGEGYDAMNAALSAQTTKGDLLVHNGAVQVRRGVGADDWPLVGRSTDATGINYEQLGTNGIADLAVTTAKIANDAITTGKIAPGAVGSTDIANDAVGSQHYADGSIQAIHLAADAITRPSIAASVAGSMDWETATTTISNTVAPTTLATLSVPAGDAIAGTLYRIRTAGTAMNNTGADRFLTLELLVGGTLVLQFGMSLEDPWGTEPRQWAVESDMLILSTTSQRFMNHARMGYPIGPSDDVIAYTYATGGASVGNLNYGGNIKTINVAGAFDIVLRGTLSVASTNLVATCIFAHLARDFPG